jgi:hypothetical protein
MVLLVTSDWLLVCWCLAVVEEELFGCSGVEFFTLVSEEVDGGTKATCPMVEYGHSYSGSLFAG